MGKHWFGDFTRADGAMRINNSVARALAKLCRKHNIRYVAASSYPHAVQMAYKHGRRTHNGMPIYQPGEPRGLILKRVRIYLIWRGETQEQTEEAIAYLLMQSPDEIMLIPDTITNASDIIKSKQDDYHEDQSGKATDQEEF